MLDLKTIAELPALSGQTVRGLYLLTGCEERTGDAGQTRLQLTLEDATGSTPGIVWSEYRAGMPAMTLMTPVCVTGVVQDFNGKAQLRVHQLRHEPVEAVPCGAALLPLGRCPEVAKDALVRLIALERSLPESLSGFLKRVLLDPRLGVPLLRCRASVRHHHAFVGGLLVHSTHLLDQITTLAKVLLPEDPMAVHLAQLGFLLHDIGKVISVGETHRDQYGLVVRHETLSLLLLAEHLRWLEGQDKSLMVALTYILEYIATPQKSRGYAEYLVAEFVVTFDQWSAATFNERDMSALLRGKRKSASKPITLIETDAANDAAYALESRASHRR